MGNKETHPNGTNHPNRVERFEIELWALKKLFLRAIETLNTKSSRAPKSFKTCLRKSPNFLTNYFKTPHLQVSDYYKADTNP